MTTNETLKVGSEIKLNGRTYTVAEQFPIGEATRKASPNLVAVFAIFGKRGAAGLLNQFSNGALKATFI